MASEWCVYTNDFVEPDAMNEDHVVPLSLGGHDRFRIRASIRGNSLVNRLHDEPFGRHPFVANMRRVRGLADRRGRMPVVRWPTEVGDAPASINWSKPQIERETFRSGGQYQLNASVPLVKGESFTSAIELDANQILSFGARLALGASYFLFGDTFRLHGLHNELRDLVNSDCAATLLELRMLNSSGRSPFWGLSWPRSGAELDPLWDHLCTAAEGHVVFTDHSTSGIVLGIGLFGGFFQWFFLISDKPREFPIGGDFELGAYLQLDHSPPTFRRTDLRSQLELVQSALGATIK